MITRAILDASATIGILTDPESAEDLRATVSAAAQVMAPALMLTEVANVLWKIERAGRLGGTDPLDLLHDAAALVDHPVYDCLYPVLARREVAALVSCDQRLLALAETVLP